MIIGGVGSALGVNGGHGNNGGARTGAYSRLGGAYSVSNLNVPSVGPLLTSPTGGGRDDHH